LKTLTLTLYAKAPNVVPLLQIPYDLSSQLPAIAGTIRNQEVHILVDTGAPTSTLEAKLVQGESGDLVRQAAILSGHRFEMEWRLRDLSVINSGNHCEAVLGNNFYDGHLLYFDTKGNVLYLYE
jgi:hypothetical protein